MRRRTSADHLDVVDPITASRRLRHPRTRLTAIAANQDSALIIAQLNAWGDQVRARPALDVTLPVINPSVNGHFVRAPGLEVGESLKLTDVVTTDSGNNGGASTPWGLIQTL
jgi:hypothetical protein